jgi:hypothetical protein
MRMRSVATALAFLALVASGAGAQVTGSGAFSARSVFRVRGCGISAGSFGLIGVVRSDGTWDAQDTQGTGYSGTHAPVGASGRKLDLQFDASSANAFVEARGVDATGLCEAEVRVISAVRKKFLLRVNRRGTVAKLALVYVFTGAAAGRQGTARYQLKAVGPWTPAP